MLKLLTRNKLHRRYLLLRINMMGKSHRKLTAHSWTSQRTGVLRERIATAGTGSSLVGVCPLVSHSQESAFLPPTETICFYPIIILFVLTVNFCMHLMHAQTFIHLICSTSCLLCVFLMQSFSDLIGYIKAAIYYSLVLVWVSHVW